MLPSIGQDMPVEINEVSNLSLWEASSALNERAANPITYIRVECMFADGGSPLRRPNAHRQLMAGLRPSPVAPAG